MTLHKQYDIVECADKTNTDETLAEQIARGNIDAWNRFFYRYSSWVYRFVYRHLNSNQADAEDLCSDIMLIAAKDIKKFDSKRGDLDAWMHGIARHRLSRFCRNRHIELPFVPDIVDQSSALDTNSFHLTNNIQVKDLVNRSLSSLPERQAAALVAKYVEGYTMDELALKMQSSPKAIESLLVRARATFRLAFTRLLDNSRGGDNYE